MRTWAYIDGFNLYYGCLRTSPYKWLNLKQLCSSLLPPFYQLEKVKYFTARVSGSVDPGAPARQLQYLRALRTMPEVEILLGTFLPKVVRRPLVNLPIAGMPIHCNPAVSLPRGQHRIGTNHEATLPVGTPHAKSPRQSARDAVKVDVHWFEEKGSDVNLAVHPCK